MSIKRKKGKHKRKIRASTKASLLLTFGAIIIVSIINIYNNTFVSEKEEKEETKYRYVNDFSQNYQIELKQNKYMETDTLQESQLYVTDLIDNLVINYNYIYEGNLPDEINCTYNIKGLLKSKYSSNGQEEEIWNKEYVLLEKKEEHTKDSILEINENLNVDLPKYNKLVNDFSEEIQIAISTKLYIVFEANITAKVNGEELENKYTNQLEITIGDKTTKIIGEQVEYKEEELKDKITVEKPNNSEINILWFILIIISVFNIIKIQKQTKTKNRITDLFKLELNNILGDCGDRIVRIDSKVRIDGKAIIEVKDINELVKLSEELYKPILYYQIPVKKEAWFMIVLDSEIYRYILK